MSARAFGFLSFVLGAAGGALVVFLLLGRPSPALAQEAPEPCQQWIVGMFSANLAEYIRLDGASPTERDLQYSSVVLPPGWEPVDVDGGLGALIPARRCLR